MSIEVSHAREGVYCIFSTYCKDSINITVEEAHELLETLAHTLYPQGALQVLTNAPQGTASENWKTCTCESCTYVRSVLER